MVAKKIKAFSLVELSVVIVIMSVILATVMVSRTLLVSAKINAAQKDVRDMNMVLGIFRNTFDCLPGDCRMQSLSQNIINQMPSDCFNLSTTTGTGNAASPGNGGTATALSIPIITFNTDTIDSDAKRTCAFYAMQALEPGVFGGSASQVTVAMNELFWLKNANAIGNGKISLAKSPANLPAISAGLGSCSTFANSTSTTTANGSSAWGLSVPVVGFYQNYGIENNTTNNVLTTSYTFSVDNPGASYTVYADSDDYYSITINGQVVANNEAGSGNAVGQFAINNIVKGVNTVVFASGNGLGLGGGALAIGTGLSGSTVTGKIFDIVSIKTAPGVQTAVGSGAASGGCPAAGGTFCSSACGTALAAIGGGATMQSSINSGINSAISYSLAGITQPQTSAIPDAMWDFRTVGSMSGGFYPYELNDTTNLSGYNGSNIMIARSAKSSTLASNAPLNTTTKDMSAFTGDFAQKYDSKFDDGMPYTGTIVAGQNISQMGSGTGCTNATTVNINTPSAPKTATYIKSSKLSNGCVVGVVLKW